MDFPCPEPPRTTFEHVWDMPENEITIGTAHTDPHRPVFLQVKGQVGGQFFRYQRMSLRDALDLAAALTQVAAASPACCSFCGDVEVDAFWTAPNEAVRICDGCTRDAITAMAQALYPPAPQEDAA